MFNDDESGIILQATIVYAIQKLQGLNKFLQPI